MNADILDGLANSALQFKNTLACAPYAARIGAYGEKSGPVVVSGEQSVNIVQISGLNCVHNIAPHSDSVLLVVECVFKQVYCDTRTQGCD